MFHVYILQTPILKDFEIMNTNGTNFQTCGDRDSGYPVVLAVPEEVYTPANRSVLRESVAQPVAHVDPLVPRFGVEEKSIDGHSSWELTACDAEMNCINTSNRLKEKEQEVEKS